MTTNSNGRGTRDANLDRRRILLGGTSIAAASALATAAPMRSAQAQQQATPPPAPRQRPNILVIFGDDIGIANVSAYSNGLMGYETPNIDRIAQEGIKFQHYYGEQSCTAGRAAFLTGQHVRFEFDAKGQPSLVKVDKVEFVDDGVGKPVGINRFIGRRPIFAFGNSDGDQQMLEWTAAGSGARFMGLVHHTDAEREWAYDRASHIGKLDKALDEAIARGWTVVDMKKDWRKIFPFEE